MIEFPAANIAQLMRYIFIVITVSILGCHPNSRNNHSEDSKAIAQIVLAIERGNSVESAHIGFVGTPSSQWNLYERLRKVASEEELVKLTDHKNAVVRCYSFQALAYKRSKNVFPILLKHLRDTATIETLSGDVGMTQLTGDYFLDVVTPKYIELDVYKLTQEERSIVDSILANDDSVAISSRGMVLQNLAPVEKNYTRIRQLVTRDQNTSAIISLARYKRAEDRELISSFFADREMKYSALFAAREFPDDYFFPFVKKAFEDEWKYSEQKGYDYPMWRMLYQTLARYPNPQTLKLFERTLQTKDEFRYNTLCTNLMTAITKYPDKAFNSIKERIKLPENYLNDVKEQLSYENER